MLCWGDKSGSVKLLFYSHFSGGISEAFSWGVKPAAGLFPPQLRHIVVLPFVALHSTLSLDNEIVTLIRNLRA